MTDGPERTGVTPRGLVGAGVARAGRLLARFDALGPIRGRAVLATLVWTVLVAAYAIGFFGASQARGTSFLDGAFFLVTWALPAILIWLAAFLAEELARLRALMAGFDAAAGPLTAALAATRESLDRHPAAPRPPDPERRAADAALSATLERLIAGQSELAADLAALRAAAAPAPQARTARPAAPRPHAARAAAPATQADLPLAAEAEAEPDLPWEDVIRALNFPRDAEDEEGFRALKAALKRRSLAQMLQAAEDVLTMLSQEGVYMDDLAAAPADAEAWRRFLAGGRGEGVAALGGVTDAAALDAARALMKEDTVFRDTTLFFLRRFDTMLQEIARAAGDAEIAALADTRSGRAFQLMARASGAFD